MGWRMNQICQVWTLTQLVPLAAQNRVIWVGFGLGLDKTKKISGSSAYIKPSSTRRGHNKGHLVLTYYMVHHVFTVANTKLFCFFILLYCINLGPQNWSLRSYKLKSENENNQIDSISFKMNKCTMVV